MKGMTTLSDIAEMLRKAHSAFLVAHVAPDGDTIGSMLGLSWALRRLGITTTLACADPVPHELQFLPGVAEISRHHRTTEDVIVAVDTSDTQRLGDVYDPASDGSVPLVVIDHHVTNTRFGTCNYVEDRSSTAEIVWELLPHFGPDTVDETVATCLLTGLVTDSQGFRTTATTVESVKTAVAMMDAGGDLARVTASVFKQRPVDSLRVWGEALTRSQYDRGVLWTEISRDVMDRNGASDEMVSGLANFMSSVTEALVAVVFHQRGPDEAEVGFRSVPGIDVSRIAFGFGGGGHAQASGCTIMGPFDDTVARVLEAVHAAVSAGRSLA